MTDDVSSFLRAKGIRLNTDLGQHFLIDSDALADIVGAADIEKGDNVVEVGPGIGVLTKELLEAGAKVTAIEIDKRMIPLLREFVSANYKLPTTNSLKIIEGNALHILPPQDGAYKVVANIPYHITSPLLRHFLLETEHRPTALTLLIQKEVAENICAPVSESILTVIVQLFGTATFVRSVRKEAFLPPPEVESAVLHVECDDEPKVSKEAAESILKLAKHAMSGRRKMLRNTIAALPNGLAALEKAGIDPTRRPQTLTIEEWIALERSMRA